MSWGQWHSPGHAQLPLRTLPGMVWGGQGWLWVCSPCTGAALQKDQKLLSQQGLKRPPGPKLSVGWSSATCGTLGNRRIPVSGSFPPASCKMWVSERQWGFTRQGLLCSWTQFLWRRNSPSEKICLILWLNKKLQEIFRIWHSTAFCQFMKSLMSNLPKNINQMKSTQGVIVPQASLHSAVQYLLIWMMFCL